MLPLQISTHLIQRPRNYQSKKFNISHCITWGFREVGIHLPSTTAATYQTLENFQRLSGNNFKITFSSIRFEEDIKKWRSLLTVNILVKPQLISIPDDVIADQELS